MSYDNWKLESDREWREGDVPSDEHDEEGPPANDVRLPKRMVAWDNVDMRYINEALDQAVLSEQELLRNSSED